MHDEGIGFGIVDNAAERLYVVVEVPRAAEVTPLDEDEVAALLGPDGPIAQHLGRYEDRPSQREMAARIAKLYSLGGIGLLEAGTGVGKSLGYLVPALRWAAANGERTIVSTNTITLQEQLVGKDLPFLETALTDQRVRFAMLKGWRNYVCLQRLDHARAAATSLFDDGARGDLEMIDAWAARTSDGSLADLPEAPRPDVWDEVAAEADLCTRLRCSHFDRCFVFAARRTAAQADVVVVNHHLLMADLAVRRASQNWTESAVLPAYARLVIDEGHHLKTPRRRTSRRKRPAVESCVCSRGSSARGVASCRRSKCSLAVPTTCSPRQVSTSCACACTVRRRRRGRPPSCCSTSSTSG